jgi:hypothetical protein
MDRPTPASAHASPVNWRWREKAVSPGPAVIIDIDGVLADAAGRQHHLENGDWRRFFDACGDDPVIEEVHRLLELLDSQLAIILVTGRPLRVQEPTVAWLTHFGIRWDLLIMREVGDYAGADDYKWGVVHDLIGAGFDLRLALDDDPRNHAMFVSEGVPCIYIHSGYYH